MSHEYTYATIDEITAAIHAADANTGDRTWTRGCLIRAYQSGGNTWSPEDRVNVLGMLECLGIEDCADAICAAL